ncbi:MAG: hypothetical protein HGB21_14670 [Nitrospirae bacterium]|nr:hypothetical protein [Nitrospirota bacterium]NTW67528.1 hypothetical protein [Nitrospirota bacterium]
MKINTPYSMILPGLITVLLVLLFSTTATAELKASYMYSFSNFTGKIPLSWSVLSADRERGEIYAVYQGAVSVFNATGMEIYRFGDGGALGNIIDVAVERDGNILVLTNGGTSHVVLRCNYRGEQVETVELKGVPAEFSLRPQRLVSWNGYLYLADLAKRIVIVTDARGSFVQGYNVGAFFTAEEKPNEENEIAGFNVDRDGNILFTVSTLFKAFRLTRDNGLQSFGGAGNIPGMFNLVGAITSDDKGFIYVADVLKSVVMIFDKDLKFQMQFGYRGEGRDNLVVPMHIAVIRDKIFVNQARNRGVSIFRLTDS